MLQLYVCRDIDHLRLEQLLRLFRALQTSRVLNIPTDVRWRMK